MQEMIVARRYSEVKEEPDSTEGYKLVSDDEAALLDQLAAFQSSFQSEIEKLRDKISRVRAKKTSNRLKKRVKEESDSSLLTHHGGFIDLT